MKTGIILAGGDLTPEFAEKIIAEYSSRGEVFLAAADAGLEICAAAGKTPDLILGDFDTVKQEVLGGYTDRKDVEVIRHNPVKDASDLELTADVLYDRGIRQVLVLGALGGRADHTLANIRLTYWMRRRGAEFILLDPRNRIRCLVTEGGENPETGVSPAPGSGENPETGESPVPGSGELQENVFTLRRDAQWGRYIGFFALGGTIRHLTLEGFKYPLKDFTLDERGLPSLTISNEITAEAGIVRFSGEPGTGLLVMETADREK